MFQLTGYNITQFACFLVYAVLIALVLYSKQVRLKRLFSFFLVAAAGASVSSLLMNLQLPYEQTLLFKMLIIPLTTLAVVTYIHFIFAFTGKNTRKIIKPGYGWVAFTSGMVVLGYLTQGLSLLESEPVTNGFGYIFTAINYINELLLIAMVFSLLKTLKKAADPEERNRTAYLFAGLGFMLIFNVLGNMIPNVNNTLTHIGYAGNAIIITYTLLRYRLLDIQILMKKWMTYTAVTICITLAYLALLLVLSNLLRLLPPQLGIPATVIMVVLFACLFNWVKSALDKGADRLFYGNRYLHRKMLLDFAGKTSTFINIEEIANALLGPLVKVIRAGQVDLLLPSRDGFSTKYVARLTEEEPIVPLTITQDSPYTRWLESKGVLLRSNLNSASEFSGLTPEEQEAIDACNVELLCPITSKQTLVGILALSGKQSHGHYTRDDIDLVTTLSRESAVAIENAQIYALAKEKADTDALTGLRNHRYFQERFNQEIEKSALSDETFSVLSIDLDFFKTYNDIYGHAMGDEILKEFGQLIRSSIRTSDVGARYGGDEFTVILLQTAAEGAEMVAERIREGLQSSMDEKGIMLTCSIGIACWRTDGITRETLIQAADKALYAAKAAGRNRICLASELKTTEPVRPETTLKEDDTNAIENIVYALAATVDTRDHYTYGHSKSVARYATELAAAMGYTREGIKRIRAAALLHDIGKLSIPDSILTKEGPLTNEEWELMKHHPEMGIGILKYIVGLRGCIDAVLFHHERYDGKGYPRGLKGENIPLDARIMSVADAYDAMTSERSYKEGRLSKEDALKELKKCAGTQFDPELVDVFIGLRRKAASMLSNISKDLPRETAKKSD
jgi:diguanylate cyclase (GGDEF)-like protein/putative nucleotidyltransferase with HDIG domain